VCPHFLLKSTGQLLTIYSAFVKYLRKKWECNEVVHQLSIGFKKAYDLYRRGSCNILFEFGIPSKLVRLIKMYLNAACNRARAGRHLSDMFPIKDGGDALFTLL
jgi:hypothetical protein